MKNSSAKMTGQTVALTAIATIAGAAFLVSCKKPGGCLSSLTPAAAKKAGTGIGIPLQAHQPQAVNHFIHHTACFTAIPVTNTRGFQQQAGVIYIIF